MSVDTATRELISELFRACKEGDGCLPEADATLNGASRAVVRAMHAEHGAAWLLHVNDGTCVSWEPGETIFNFCASIVLPAPDEELLSLVAERLATPYTNSHDDFVRIDAIHARAREVGGRFLIWT